jgi:hypothetical protein
VIVLKRGDGGMPMTTGGILVTDGELILGGAGASAVEDEEAVRTAVERWQER